MGAMRKHHLFFIAGALSLAATPVAGNVDPAIDPVPTSDAVPIAYLVDMSSGQILHAKEADRRFMPASITKVMTLYVAFEMMEAGDLSPDQTFTMSDDVFSAWDRKGSTMFIPADAQVTVDNLLRGIAAVSANDGAAMLAQGAGGSLAGWIERMNVAARELEMHDTHFGTPNGWPDEGRTFTTAEDLTKLARAMITRHPELYAEYVGLPGFRYNDIAQDNRDPITGRVDGADGIKTGFTNQAGNGFLGSAERDGRRLILVAAGASSVRERNALARDLMEWGFSAYDTWPLFAADEVIASARVQNGMERTVPLRADGPVRATVPRGAGGVPKLTLRYEGPLKAPVEKGERLGELEIAVEGQPPSRIPLHAAASVAEAGGFARLRNGLLGIVQ